MERFPLRYGRFAGPLLGALGLGTRRSGVTVDGDRLGVTMGWGFRGEAALEAVQSVASVDDRVLDRGVHGWRGDWKVNGAGDRLVEIRFEPPMRARTLVFPLAVRRLRISVEDPGGLVARLGR